MQHHLLLTLTVLCLSCVLVLICMQPLDYQQTLIKSFTMAGVGLHTGEYGEWDTALG